MSISRKVSPRVEVTTRKKVYTMADFKYGVNTNVNIAVAATRVGNTLQ